MHVRVKRALHVHGANSFRPFRLMPPKGKVSGSETTMRKERVCRPFSELVRKGGMRKKSVQLCACEHEKEVKKKEMGVKE